MTEAGGSTTQERNASIRTWVPPSAAKQALTECSSPAARTGIQAGDLIVKLDGLRDPKWEDVEVKTLTTVDEAIPVEILRDGIARTPGDP